MGPKHDTINDTTKTNTMTDNELLPGLDIAHHADPKVKGWLSAEFPTETSKSMTSGSTQGKGSAEPGGEDLILIDLDGKDPPGNMPKINFQKDPKLDSKIFQSPGGGMVPIPMHGDEDLLDLPIGGRGKRDTPRSNHQEGNDEWYGGGVPKLPIGPGTEQAHMINSDSSEKDDDINEDDVSSIASLKSTPRGCAARPVATHDPYGGQQIYESIRAQATERAPMVPIEGIEVIQKAIDEAQSFVPEMQVAEIVVDPVPGNPVQPAPEPLQNVIAGGDLSFCSPKTDLTDGMSAELSMLIGDSPQHPAPAESYSKIPTRPRGTPPKDSPLGAPHVDKKPRIMKDEPLPQGGPEGGIAGGHATGVPASTELPSPRTRSRMRPTQGPGAARPPSVASSIASRISIVENCADPGPNCKVGPESRCPGSSGVGNACRKPVCIGCSHQCPPVSRDVPLQGLSSS